ncbi:LysR family transcriptional regulator [Pseudooceanicola sp. 502str34]
MEFAQRLRPSHLSLLLRIAETGQLQRAAQLCAMSQPAASRILAEVEERAGGPLFERHPKGMRPTALGEICVRHATIILDQFAALEAESRRISAGEVGRVRVGAVTGPAVGLLMPAVRDVKAATPDIEMTIEVAPSTTLVRGLVDGNFDFVIARLPPEHDSRDFRLYPARSEVVSLLVRPDHPLAGQGEVALEQLQGFEWVIQEVGSPIRQAVEAAFLERELRTPARVTNSSSFLVVLAMLAESDAIAPQTEEVAQMLAEGPLGGRLAALRLAEPILVSPCFIIQNRFRQIPPAARHVLDRVFAHL